MENGQNAGDRTYRIAVEAPVFVKAERAFRNRVKVSHGAVASETDEANVCTRRRRGARQLERQAR